MVTKTDIIEAKLAEGTIVYVQATLLGGEERVASRTLSFEGVTSAIEEIAKSVVETLRKVQPRKASVEFGLEVALQAGQLTALLVQGSTTANLKITLEWSE